MASANIRPWAAVTVIEGIANLILSIALVPPLGIVGDALGTAIPLAFTCLVFYPRHMKKQIGVPVGTFVREAYTLPILLTLPLVGVLWLANRFFYPRNLVQLALELLVVVSIYGVGTPVGLSHQSCLSCSRDCGLASIGTSRADANSCGWGGIPE